MKDAEPDLERDPRSHRAEGRAAPRRSSPRPSCGTGSWAASVRVWGITGIPFTDLGDFDHTARADY